MYIISDENKALFNQNKCVRKLIIYRDPYYISDIEPECIVSESFSYNESLTSQSEFKFGLCESDSLKIDLALDENAAPIYENYHSVPEPIHIGEKINVYYDSNNIRVYIGDFVITKCEPDDDKIIYHINATRYKTKELELSYFGKQRYDYCKRKGLGYGGRCTFVMCENMHKRLFKSKLYNDGTKALGYPVSFRYEIGHGYSVIVTAFKFVIHQYEFEFAEKFYMWQKNDVSEWLDDEKRKRYLFDEFFYEWAIRDDLFTEEEAAQIVDDMMLISNTFVTNLGIWDISSTSTNVTTYGSFNAFKSNCLFCKDQEAFYPFFPVNKNMTDSPSWYHSVIYMPYKIGIQNTNSWILREGIQWDGPLDDDYIDLTGSDYDVDAPYPKLYRYEEDLPTTTTGGNILNYRLDFDFLIYDNDIDSFDFVEFAEAYCELLGCFGKYNRMGTLWDFKRISYEPFYSMIMPSNDLNPSDNLYPLGRMWTPIKAYQYLRKDEYMKFSKNGNYLYYKSVSVTYDNQDGDHVQKTMELSNVYKPSNVSIEGLNYSLAYNYIVDHSVINDEYMTKILSTVATELSKVSYQPGTLECLGLPWVEAGDLIEIETEDGGELIPVFNRTLSGIYMLTDTIENV